LRKDAGGTTLLSDKPRILIAGGTEPGRLGLARRLGQDSYAVLVASDGSLNIEKTRVQDPNLVLLDIRGGAGDGDGILESIRADKDLRTLPVIVLGPLGGGESVEHFLANGADDFLLDPISPSMLRAQINEYLAIGRQRRETQERAEREGLLKIEHDVQIARQIQLSFLPSELPQLAGWEFAARFYPAREVAGDFYDAFMMTQGRRVGFVMGDVCDKGVGAALFMALTRSLIRAFAQQHYSLGWADVLGDGPSTLTARDLRRGGPSIGMVPLKNAILLTNNYMTTNHLDLNMFATIFFGMVDPATGGLAYINGGHNPPFLLGRDGTLKKQLKPTGPAVGMMADSNFVIGEASLDPGDTLLIYTDGLLDARDPAGHRFSEDRLNALARQPISSAKALLDRLDNSVHQHMRGAVQYDDITLLAVRRSEDTAL
jgi:phosphoserine phosphatase RsbU/P